MALTRFIRLESLGDVLGSLSYLGRCGNCSTQFMSRSDRVVSLGAQHFCEACASAVEAGFASCASRFGVDHVGRDDGKAVCPAFAAGYALAFDVAHGWQHELGAARRLGLLDGYSPRGGWGWSS